jgi:hypothetical protein
MDVHNNKCILVSIRYSCVIPHLPFNCHPIYNCLHPDLGLYTMKTMAVSHPCWRAAAVAKKRMPLRQSSDFFTSWMTSVKSGEQHLPGPPLTMSLSSIPRRFLSYKTPPHSSSGSTENVDIHKRELLRQNAEARDVSKQELVHYGPWPIPLHQYQTQTKQPLTPVSRFKSSSRREYKQNHSNSSSSSSSTSNSRRKQQQGINNDYHDYDTALVKASEYVYRRLPHSTAAAPSATSPSISNSGHSLDPSRLGVTSTRRRGETARSENDPSNSSLSTGSTISTTTNNRLKVLPSIDASALLNPKKFCKDTAKFSHTHNVHRTIHGTEAARRLLRGKKDFIVAARQLTNAGSTPMLLEGHGVPQPLFQHCVDLADALLLHYGPDVVECSFRNYHISGSNNTSNSKCTNPCDDNSIPPYFRILKRNASKATLASKPYYCRFQDDESGDKGRDLDDLDDDIEIIDWDHHLKLYLTVMERLATGLGLVLEVSTPQKRVTKDHTGTTGIDRNNIGTSKKKQQPPIDEFDYFDDDHDENNDVDGHDFTSSPLLFPLRPYWNVSIVRNAHFDIQPNNCRSQNPSTIDSGRHTANYGGWGDDNNGSNRNEWNSNGDRRRRDGRADHGPVPPFPIVDVIQERSKTKGHIIISLQGYATPNDEFSVTRRRPSMQPVTMLFDACFRKPTAGFSQE